MSFFKKTLAVAALSAAVSYGAGFTILEQSTAGIGRALAGMTVDTTDPASLFFNPSTPAFFDHEELSIGSHTMHVNANFKDKGSTPSLGDDESGNGGGWVLIPNMYYVKPINERLAFGIGTSATSGTRTDYNPHWIGRYTATETEITVMDLTPTLAYKVRDDLSIGVGLVLEYAHAVMSNQVNLNSVGLGDAKLHMNGDSFAVGWAVGFTYVPWEGGKIGMGYRSRMTHELDLETKIKSKNNRALNAAGYGTKSKGDADLKLPSMVNFGISHAINEKWDVMADVSWSEWSVMDELVVKLDKPVMGQSRSKQEMHWQDNWRVALGTSYKYTEKLTLRTGIAFDATPVQDDWRNTRLPDSNRYWLSFGLGYKLTEHVSVDLGYTHIFFPTVSYTQYSDTTAADGNRYVKGKAKGDCDIFSFALRYRF